MYDTVEESRDATFGRIDAIYARFRRQPRMTAATFESHPSEEEGLPEEDPRKEGTLR